MSSNNSHLFSFIILTTLLLINTFAKSVNNTLSNNDKVLKKSGDEDQIYLIFVNNTFGEINIFEKPKNLKRQEIDSYDFAFSLMDEIHELIIENKDTYKNQEKIEEIENKSNLRKRSNEEQPLTIYENFEFVRPISSVGNSLVLTAYLSKVLVEKIKNKKYIKDVLPSKKGKLCNDTYYNSKDILEETYWTDLSVQENVPLHLSLISQGIFHKKMISKYDNTYYYPSSAGEDIDIIIVDTGFDFGYSEFENIDVRSARCIAYVHGDDSLVNETDETYCGHISQDHGERVADLAGGLRYGVAKKANIYAISVPEADGYIFFEDVVAGLQYIVDYHVRPYKTIVNLSHRFLVEKDQLYYEQYELLVNKLTEKGAIVTASAGNEGSDIYHNVSDDENQKGSLTIPCVYENTVCVGGIDSRQESNYEKNYLKHNSSNYGDNVKIWAPFTVHTQFLKSNKLSTTIAQGTSYSAPIVAGVMATIMSEFSGSEISKDLMMDYLTMNALPFYFNDEVHYLINNGKHIVYSKDGNYFGCGISAGNRSCEDFCTSDDSCNLLESKKYDCNLLDGEFIYNTKYNGTGDLEYACLVTVPDNKRKISIYDSAWRVYDNQLKCAYSKSTFYKECDSSSEQFDSNVCFDKIETMFTESQCYFDLEFYREECERKNGVFLTDESKDFICLMNYIGDDITDRKYCIEAGSSPTDVYAKKVYCVNDYYTNYNSCNQVYSEFTSLVPCLFNVNHLNLHPEQLIYVEVYDKNDREFL